MLYMSNLISKIKGRISAMLYCLFCINRCKRNSDTILLVNTPTHGNIGDHALAVAEYNLFFCVFPAKKVIELPGYVINYASNRVLRKVIGNSQVFIHAGGFIGTLWPNEEKAVKKVLRIVKNNKVCILPQTITFSKDEEGEKEKAELKEICKNILDLKVVVRDTISFEIAKELFDLSKVYYSPDMVISFLPEYHFDTEKENKCLLCLRNDCEKVISSEHISLIEEAIHRVVPNMRLEEIDTVKPYNIDFEGRENEVKKLLSEFSKAKLVITDRLHGMLFAARMGVPCVAIDNSNKKVSNVYEWIKSIGYVEFVDEISNIQDTIENVLNVTELSYPSEEMRNKASDLIKIVYGNE